MMTIREALGTVSGILSLTTDSVFSYIYLLTFFVKHMLNPYIRSD